MELPRRDPPADPDLGIATAAEVDRVVGELLPPLLQHLGFERIGRGRRWVRARTPLREVFEVTALRGPAWGPHWGISLDFVPHVRGESVCSHRTNKSAVIDILFDPIGSFGEVGDWRFDGRRRGLDLRSDAARVMPGAVSRALDWFASWSPDNLLERIEEHRRTARYSGGLTFDNRVQQPLAYAFLLAKSGRVYEAHAQVERWAEGLVPTRISTRLHAMVEASAPASGRGVSPAPIKAE